MSTEARRFEIEMVRLQQEYNVEAVKVALAILGGQIDDKKTQQSRAFAIEILKKAYPNTPNVDWDAWAIDGTVSTIPNLYPQSPIISKGASEDYLNSPELKAAIKDAVTSAIGYAIQSQGGMWGGQIPQTPITPALPPSRTIPWKDENVMPMPAPSPKNDDVMTVPKFQDNKN